MGWVKATLARELTIRRNRFADLHQDSIACQRLLNTRQRLQRMERILNVLGPEATLRRGYSIIMNVVAKSSTQRQPSAQR
jgi:exonuclease VII large subunit